MFFTLVRPSLLSETDLKGGTEKFAVRKGCTNLKFLSLDYGLDPKGATEKFVVRTGDTITEKNKFGLSCPD